jgi:hypothetical protein
MQLLPLLNLLLAVGGALIFLAAIKYLPDMMEVSVVQAGLANALLVWFFISCELCSALHNIGSGCNMGSFVFRVLGIPPNLFQDEHFIGTNVWSLCWSCLPTAATLVLLDSYQTCCYCF